MGLYRLAYHPYRFRCSPAITFLTFQCPRVPLEHSPQVAFWITSGYFESPPEVSLLQFPLPDNKGLAEDRKSGLFICVALKALSTLKEASVRKAWRLAFRNVSLKGRQPIRLHNPSYSHYKTQMHTENTWRDTTTINPLPRNLVCTCMLMQNCACSVKVFASICKQRHAHKSRAPRYFWPTECRSINFLKWASENATFVHVFTQIFFQ